VGTKSRPYGYFVEDVHPDHHKQQRIGKTLCGTTALYLCLSVFSHLSIQILFVDLEKGKTC